MNTNMTYIEVNIWDWDGIQPSLNDVNDLKLNINMIYRVT